MHHGIAYDHHVGNRGGFETGDHRTEPAPYDVAKLFCTGWRERMLHPAHDVAAVNGLPVQSCADRVYLRSGEIHELRHYGGGAEIDRDAKTFARREMKRAIVRENG